MQIEVIVQNDQEAMQAEQFGATRLELVSAISEGGLTPSYGSIKRVLSSVTIPVQVMIRPHAYHFNYSKTDRKIILEDIQALLNLGGKRIVFGALKDDKTIDTEFLEEIIALSSDLDITFHRAFDEVDNQQTAYEALANYSKQVKRILTSGGKINCEEGKSQLRALVNQSFTTDGPAIMPGSGLSSANIQELHQRIGAKQYHFGKAMRLNHSFAEGFDKQAFEQVLTSLKE
ncbi:copper homeostasis protein CutC [Alkalihalobacillus alcalophilus ATCC 27647 = CGMCC 1.3604]|uniref:PF03932 family protein CutC n=1 Tax=Alkalihalobacillus alcalophilus ATCC 27647 = CGMCC 1.3604 TaxID=1218173 RepID=A0A094WLC0_ALKAL|nr:copper homeostasis protein CutC [Alkalihalobacillus alcalophilus]KGA97661.1 copper homeostasis protein CutC [Alkalihalobacillus alcalophilus ATCC 27647 = CGMCC 1.3604]MED1561304.1 copper homeostasis protein CutC [Alkalihalobacillus alcalophilus]THG91466.1 copper homeostasis protein CutC [Alkalihalobacillus alcalophilus ATCC 27647 = CGMCC 1.3604]